MAKVQCPTCGQYGKAAKPQPVDDKVAADHATLEKLRKEQARLEAKLEDNLLKQMLLKRKLGIAE
jgi:hypothetical protein